MASIWVWKEPVFKTESPTIPREIPGVPAVAKVVAGRGTLLALSTDGSVWQWEAGRDVFAGDLPPLTAVPGLPGDVSDIVTSDGTHYALMADGTLWAWGENHSGQVGDGTTESRTAPTRVLNLTAVVSVTSEKGSTFAVQRDGSVWAWGRDHSGTLGDGTQFPPLRQVTSPVKLPNLTNAVSVSTAFPASSAENGYALRADGTVWAWGDDADGQLGDGTLEGRWTPVPVPALSDVVSVATGSSISQDAHVTAYAVTRDGSVLAWGANDGGQLGDGTTANRAWPAVVPGVTDVIAISPNWAAAYALKSDGTVWLWGSNLYSTRSEVPVIKPHPVQMAGLPRIASLYAHLSPAYAIGVDGSVWRWDHDWETPPEQVQGVTGASGVEQCRLQYSAALTDAAERPAVTIGGDTDEAADSERNLLSSAAAHFQSGEIDAAVTALQSAADGGSPLAMYELARHFHSTNRESDAIGLVQKAAALGLREAQEALIESEEPVQIGHAQVTVRGFQLRFPQTSESSNYRTVDQLSSPRHSRYVDLGDGTKTALMHWSAGGDVEAVEELLDDGADVNAVDSDGDTALYYALSNGNFEIAELLLARGADPNIAGDSGIPLHVAADKGWDEAVTRLLAHGAIAGSKGLGGLTATMFAAGSGQTTALRLLLSAGANPDALDDDGDPALFYGASRGRVEAVRVLLAAGANPNPQPGASGQTPHSIAMALATSSYPLPPGSTRADFAAIADLLSKQRASPAPTSASARAPQSGAASSVPAPATPRVEVLGYTESYAVEPAVKIFWNGSEVGRVEARGKFSFDAAGAGEVRFKCGFRSAKVSISQGASGTIRIQLSWNRTWGRLIASQLPS